MRNHDMAKTHALSFRVEPELKSGLERAAQADRRSLSSLIEKILAEWVENYEAPSARAAKPGGRGSRA
jgi:predicted transcriptional regulator